MSIGFTKHLHTTEFSLGYEVNESLFVWQLKTKPAKEMILNMMRYHRLDEMLPHAGERVNESLLSHIIRAMNLPSILYIIVWSVSIHCFT